MNIIPSQEEMKKMGVYKISNNINNKVYIGSTSRNFKIRVTKHLYDLSCKLHHSNHLQKAFDKYNSNNFTFSILEICDASSLIDREQYWIDYYKCYKRDKGYNILVKAYSSKGYKHTEESLLLIGELSKRRGSHPNSINAMNAATRGLKRTKSHKIAVSKTHSKPVIQLDLEGNFIKEWSSRTEVVKTWNINTKNASNISRCILGKCKSFKGFMWICKENYDPNIIYKYSPKINGYKNESSV